MSASNAKKVKVSQMFVWAKKKSFRRSLPKLTAVFVIFGIFIIFLTFASGEKGDSGTATAEKRLTQDPNVLWMGTFDNAPDWKAKWGLTSNTPQNEQTFSFGVPVLEQAERGKSGKISLPPGLGTRFLANSWFQRMNIEGQEEVYLKYDIFLPVTHQCTKGGKLPGLGAYLPPLGNPNETPNANNFSAGSTYRENSATGRILFTEKQTVNIDGKTQTGCTLKSYLYAKYVANRTYQENDSQSGRSLVWNEAIDYRNSTSPRYVVEFGKWNTIVLRYKMNTPGQNNGLFEGYINGNKGISVNDIQYRTANYPDMKFNMMHMHVYYGGASSDYAPTLPQDFYFDDFVISKGFVAPRVNSLGATAR